MYAPASTSPAAGSPYAPTLPPADHTAGGETSGPDLTIFLLAHRVFRQEFARLAVSCSEHGLDSRRVAAIEEQIAMMARSLHSHHSDEDTTIWPLLRERDPAAAILLDSLERDHARIDPLIAAITDRSVALSQRAGLLEELSDLLNAHLDREEAEAVPLIRRHFSAAEWEENGKAHTKDVRKELPSFIPTMMEHMSEAEVGQLLATGPKLLVLIYKVAWRRRWAKLSPLIYGTRCGR